MNILITGASGFIGGFLVEEALRRNYQVWAAIRHSSNRSRLTDPRIHFIELDYANKEHLDQQMKEQQAKTGAWDFVIHNAGVTKTIDKRQFDEVNAMNTSRLLQSLSVCPPRKFLLMSSLSSYGKGDEDTFQPIRLQDKPSPDTAYGKSKLKAERFVRTQTNFPYIILRPTGVYGPGEKDYFLAVKSVKQGLNVAAGIKPQRITFIYVRDLVKAVFLALEKKEIVNKAYFVADGDVWYDYEYTHLIQQLLGRKRVINLRVPLSLVHVGCLLSEGWGLLTHQSMTLNTDKYHILSQRNWICDVEPIQKDLGFVADYPLQRGLEESIAWYKQKGWL